MKERNRAYELKRMLAKQFPGVNAEHLVTLTKNSRWSTPDFLNVNARSLSIEKLDELLVVARMNDVASVNVVETWLRATLLRNVSD